MDTLSWARRGAIATGVDFSPAAIRMARELNTDLGMDVRFLEADVANLHNILKETFDIVFSSYGVLCWLPDLTAWAQTIAHSLEPDGVFLLVEGHPVNDVFLNESDTSHLQVAYSYFHNDEPTRWDDDEPYADRSENMGMPSFEWTHSLSDILNALIQAGLTIEHLNEFPFCFYDHYPFLEKCSDGWYRFKDGKQTIPMMVSLLARKSAANQRAR
jgi:SAM-dependent methyltransferase